MTENLPCVIMMIGLPGSGKTTWANDFAKRNGYIVHSSDKVRLKLYGDESIKGNCRLVFKTLYEDIDSDLSNGKSVIIDSTALEPRYRADIRKYHDKGYSTIAVVMNIQLDECKRRNMQRERIVPEEIIDRMYSSMIYPNESEGFDEIMFIS